MGIARLKKMHLIKFGGAADDPILGALRRVCAGCGVGRAKYAALRVPQPQLGRVEAPPAARPRFPSWKPALRCSSPPPPHGITAKRGILYGNLFYIYVSVTERTININGTKARCSFLLPPPCLVVKKKKSI